MTTDRHMEKARDLEFDFDCDWTADSRRRGEEERQAAIKSIATALSEAYREGEHRGMERCADMAKAKAAEYEAEAGDWPCAPPIAVRLRGLAAAILLHRRKHSMEITIKGKVSADPRDRILTLEAVTRSTALAEGEWPAEAKFKHDDRVTKIKGSSWTGRVCGWYRSSLAPLGYYVESENEPGSVQLYPESALSAPEEAP